MATKHNDYHFTIASLAKQLKEGSSTIRGILQELREFSWLTFTRDPKGGGIYTLHWSVSTATSPLVENPLVESTTVAESTRINKIDSFINKSNNNTPEVGYATLRSFYPNGGFSPGEATKQRFLALTSAQQQHVLELAYDQFDKGGTMTYSALLIKQVAESPEAAPTYKQSAS